MNTETNNKRDKNENSLDIFLSSLAKSAPVFHRASLLISIFFPLQSLVYHIEKRNEAPLEKVKKELKKWSIEVKENGERKVGSELSNLLKKGGDSRSEEKISPALADIIEIVSKIDDKAKEMENYSEEIKDLVGKVEEVTVPKNDYFSLWFFFLTVAYILTLVMAYFGY